MPWVLATLKGQRVYARASDNGDLLAVGGRVEIRYKPNDGRLYHATLQNLSSKSQEVLPDETCGEAAKVEKAKPEKAAAKPRATKLASPTDAPVHVVRDGQIVAYTDGACTGNPGPAGLGVVLLRPDGRVEVSEYLGHATNNIAELTAVLRAVEEAADLDSPLVVHTDSQYSIGVLSKGWKAKANTDLIERIRAALRSHKKTTFVYVKGHAGIPLNERCDALAREAVKAQKSWKRVYPKNQTSPEGSQEPSS